MELAILPISPKVKTKLKKHNLIKKFYKQLRLLKENPRHPSLNSGLLEPKKAGIYSFRIDRKFRILFIFRDDKHEIEILNITTHYQ